MKINKATVQNWRAKRGFRIEGRNKIPEDHEEAGGVI